MNKTCGSEEAPKVSTSSDAAGASMSHGAGSGNEGSSRLTPPIRADPAPKTPPVEEFRH